MEDEVIEHKLVRQNEIRSLRSNPLACHMARVILVYLFIFFFIGLDRNPCLILIPPCSFSVCSYCCKYSCEAARPLLADGFLWGLVLAELRVECELSCIVHGSYLRGLLIVSICKYHC